jgi:hypothetical protein
MRENPDRDDAPLRGPAASAPGERAAGFAHHRARGRPRDRTEAARAGSDRELERRTEDTVLSIGRAWPLGDANAVQTGSAGHAGEGQASPMRLIRQTRSR